MVVFWVGHRFSASVAIGITGLRYSTAGQNALVARSSPLMSGQLGLSSKLQSRPAVRGVSDVAKRHSVNVVDLIKMSLGESLHV